MLFCILEVICHKCITKEYKGIQHKKREGENGKSECIFLSPYNNHISLPSRHPTFLSFLSPVSAKEIANVKKCHPVWQMSASASPVASLPQILSYFFFFVLAFWTKNDVLKCSKAASQRSPSKKYSGQFYDKESSS